MFYLTTRSTHLQLYDIVSYRTSLVVNTRSLKQNERICFIQRHAQHIYSYMMLETKTTQREREREREREKTHEKVLLWQPIKSDERLRQPIACYKIAKRTYNFVMTYVGNRKINMTLVMLFLVGNKHVYDFPIPLPTPEYCPDYTQDSREVLCVHLCQVVWQRLCSRAKCQWHHRTHKTRQYAVQPSLGKKRKFIAMWYEFKN